MEYIFIHGSGQKSTSWNETISYLKNVKNISCPNLFELLDGKEAIYENLYSAFVKYCNSISEPINLCGLSLGGILALNYVTDYPEKIKSLVLICTPYKIQSIIYNIQMVIFRFLPKNIFNKFGLPKEDMLKLGNSMKKLDFSNKLQKIICPTLVVCGSKDSVNIKSAKYLTKNIKNAILKIIENTGHVINEENPKELALKLEEYYNGINK